MDQTVYNINTIFPQHCILELFSYLEPKELCRISTVCSYWNDLAQDPSLYTKIKLTKEDQRRNPQVSDLIKEKRYLRKLVLKDVENTAEILKLASHNCPKLRHLSVQGTSLTSDAVKSLSDNCHWIRELVFAFCDFREVSISYFSRLKHLRSLILFACPVDDLKEIVELVEGCSVLEELYIDAVYTDHDDGHVMLRRIVSNSCDTLKSLYFFEPRDEPLELLKQSGKQLQILDISFDNRVTEAGVRSVLSMSSLVWLCIHGTYNVSSFAWSSAFQTHKLCNLRHLNLSSCSGIDNGVLKVIGESFPLLSYLNISYCFKITDEGISLLMASITAPLKFLLVAEVFLKGVCFSEIPEKLPHLLLLDANTCLELNASLLSDLQVRMPQLGLRWWDNKMEVNRINIKYRQLLNEKELQRFVTLKDVKKMYGHM